MRFFSAICHIYLRIRVFCNDKFKVIAINARRILKVKLNIMKNE
jgi:hypothetical protein